MPKHDLRPRSTAPEHNPMGLDGPVTPEAVEYETAQRAQLIEAAQSITKAKAAQGMQERLAPPVPAKPAAGAPLEKKKAAADAQLADAAERVRVAERAAKEVEQAEQAAKVQRDGDRLRLIQERDRLQQEAAALQQELQAAQAADLAAAEARRQWTREREVQNLTRVDLLETFKAETQPLVDKIVSALVKLRGLATAKGQILATIDGLNVPPGLEGDLHARFRGVRDTAGKLRQQLAVAIEDHGRVLRHLETFTPDPSTSGGRTAINEVRADLERLSGVTTDRLVGLPHPFLVPRRSGLEGTTPVLKELTESVAELLARYAATQKEVTAATAARPADVVIVLEKPFRPKKNPEPPQAIAEGVSADL